MLFEILAVLILTFFASLGMIEASRWLLRQSTKCRMKKRVFYIAEAGSVPENILEDSVRAAFSETETLRGEIILDCRGASPEAKEICRRLCERFYCSAAENEKELKSLLLFGLHGDEKDI